MKNMRQLLAALLVLLLAVSRSGVHAQGDIIFFDAEQPGVFGEGASAKFNPFSWNPIPTNLQQVTTNLMFDLNHDWDPEFQIQVNNHARSCCPQPMPHEFLLSSAASWRLTGTQTIGAFSQGGLEVLVRTNVVSQVARSSRDNLTIWPVIYSISFTSNTNGSISFGTNVLSVSSTAVVITNRADLELEPGTPIRGSPPQGMAWLPLDQLKGILLWKGNIGAMPSTNAIATQPGNTGILSDQDSVLIGFRSLFANAFVDPLTGGRVSTWAFADYRYFWVRVRAPGVILPTDYSLGRRPNLAIAAGDTARAKLKIDGSGVLSWDSLISYKYRVQSSLDLVRWDDLGTTLAKTNLSRFVDSTARQPFKAYRVIELP